MRTWKAVVVVAAVCVGVVLAAVGCFFACFYGPFWLGSRTAYAPGFSEERFNQIRVGMTEAEVIRLAGEPLEARVWVKERGEWRLVRSGPRTERDVSRAMRGQSTTVTFLYSAPDPRRGGSHYRRFVVFDQAGHVRRVVSDFWID